MITNVDTLNMMQKIYNLMSNTDREAADKVISGEWYRNEPYKATEIKYHDMGREEIFTPFLVGEVIRALKQDIKQSESGKPRSSGKKSVVNALLKEQARLNLKETAKYTLVENGKQYCCDGVIAFAFTEIDDTFPICPDKLKENYVKVEKVISDSRDTKTIELEMPSYKLLEAYYKRNKNKYSKTLFCFGENLPTVNVELLLKAMKALPTAKFYMTKTVLTPIYAIDEDGNEAIVMPIRADESAGRTQI